jgi:peptidoglycan/xylan/chitin deacetylase (PgdA/CDA1 family)
MQKRSGVNTIYPFYHVVNDYTAHYLRHAYRVMPVERFENDLVFLLKHFHPVSLSEMQHLNPMNNSKPLFHLTFDDGLKECYHTIMPILEKKGVPATFFVNPEFVDNKALFHRYKASTIVDRIRDVNATQRAALKTVLGRGELIYNLKHINYNTAYKLDQCARILDIDWDDYLKTHQPYMKLSQLKELVDKGFSVGAHTMSHPELYLIEPAKQLNQIRNSIHWITEHLPQELIAFSFPFTDWGITSKTLQQLHSEFPEIIYFGTAGIKQDDRMIQRIPMEYTFYSGEQVLKMEYLYYWLKGIFGKNKRVR